MTARNILVTGGCGYLGSQLIRDLAGHEQSGPLTIRIVDNLNSGSYQALADLPEDANYEFIEADLLDSATMGLALRGMDTVIHLAGVVTSPVSFQHPRRCEQINHWATVNLVQQAKKLGIKHFIYTSTTGVYGTGGPFAEDATCRPIGTYANSKLAAENGIRGLTDEHFRCTLLRLGSIYGYAPVMCFKTVANRFALAAVSGSSLCVFGDGEQKRPYIHVRDASAAIKHFLHDDSSEPVRVYNALGNNVSIMELAGTLASLRDGIEIRYTEQDILNHLSLEAKVTAIAGTGWVPQIGFADGFREILTHFGRIKPVKSSRNQ